MLNAATGLTCLIGHEAFAGMSSSCLPLPIPYVACPCSQPKALILSSSTSEGTQTNSTLPPVVWPWFPYRLYMGTHVSRDIVVGHAPLGKKESMILACLLVQGHRSKVARIPGL